MVTAVGTTVALIVTYQKEIPIGLLQFTEEANEPYLNLAAIVYCVPTYYSVYGNI